MRWEDLFADLEGQLEASESAVAAADVAERARIGMARTRLTDRLRVARGAWLEVTVEGAGQVGGILRRVGPDWFLLELPTAATALVSLPAVLSLRGLPAPAAEPGSEGPVLSRLALGYALRALARDRSALVLTMRDGSQLSGTIDRVGTDFIDLAEHAIAEPRRRAAVSGLRTVPLGGLAVVRSG